MNSEPPASFGTDPLNKQMQRSRDCISNLGKSADGKIFVIYLRDGTKISIGRDRSTKGPAWLEISQQAKIVAMRRPSRNVQWVEVKP